MKENDWVAENRAVERQEQMRDTLEDILDQVAPWFQKGIVMFAIILVMEIALALLVLVPAAVVWAVLEMSGVK